MEQGTSAAADAGSPVEIKLCECGCGQPAPIAKSANSARGQAKGQPLRFVRGHFAKLNAAQLAQGRHLAEAPAGVKLCECGCGQPAPIAAMTSRARGYVKGAPMRFVAGHQRAPEGPKPSLRRLFIEEGQRIGKSVVIDPEVVTQCPSKPAVRAARMLCDCGTEYTRSLVVLLRAPSVQSCRECIKYTDYAGRRFGKLTAIRWVGSKPSNEGRVGCWLCRCDCGNEIVAPRKNLVDGSASSCGCARFGPYKGYAMGEAAFKAVLRNYQAGAESRGLSWNLTDDDVRRLTSLDCHYCGVAPATIRRGRPNSGDFVYNGIDRVDNTRGYEPGNVVPCCKTCNYSKSDMPYDEFLAWIVRLASFHFFRPEVMPTRLLAANA